jgi:hypothetical protein
MHDFPFKEVVCYLLFRIQSATLFLPGLWAKTRQRSRDESIVVEQRKGRTLRTTKAYRHGISVMPQIWSWVEFCTPSHAPPLTAFFFG